MILKPWLLLSPVSIMISVSTLFFSYLICAIRIFSYFKLDIKGAYPTCVKLVIQHTFYNNILPMCTGEISFPILMSRYFNISTIQSVPDLLWFRLLDLHTIVSIGIYSVLKHDEYSILINSAIFLWLCLPWVMYHLSNRARHLLVNRKNTKFTY